MVKSYYRVFLASQPPTFTDVEVAGETESFKLYRMLSAADVSTWSSTPQNAVSAMTYRVVGCQEMFAHDPKLRGLAEGFKEKLDKQVKQMLNQLKVLAKNAEKSAAA